VSGPVLWPQPESHQTFSIEEVTEEVMKSVNDLNERIVRHVSGLMVDFRMDVSRRIRSAADTPQDASNSEAGEKVVELGGQPTPSSTCLLSASFPANGVPVLVPENNAKEPQDAALASQASAHASQASRSCAGGGSQNSQMIYSPPVSPAPQPKRVSSVPGEYEVYFVPQSPRPPLDRKLTPDSAEVFDSMLANTTPRLAKPSARRPLTPEGRGFVHSWTTQGSAKFETFRRQATSKVFHRESCLREIVESKPFRFSCIVVIVLYAAWLGVATDYGVRHPQEEETREMMLTEVCFVSLFVVELCLKLSAYRLAFFIGHAWAWNNFDFVTVATALYEAALRFAKAQGPPLNVAYLRILRLMKILRILRVVRLFRFFRELRIMLLSVASSIRSLVWSLVLLFLVVYGLAITFAQASTEHLKMAEQSGMGEDMQDVLRDFWGSLPKAMITWYQCVTNGLEWKVPAEPFRRHSPVYFILFLLSIAFLTLSMLNILTGIFVENALKASSDDQANVAYDNMISEQRFVKELQEFIQKMDMDQSGTLSWEEFEAHMQDPYLRSSFERLGLTITDAELFYRLVCAHSGQKEVDVESFTAGCLKLKGDAKSLDLQALMYETRVMKKWQHRLWAEVVEIQTVLREVLLTRQIATPRASRAAIPQQMLKDPLQPAPTAVFGNELGGVSNVMEHASTQTRATEGGIVEGSLSGTWRSNPSSTLGSCINSREPQLGSGPANVKKKATLVEGRSRSNSSIERLVKEERATRVPPPLTHVLPLAPSSIGDGKLEL